jgi:hypothetical protein
MNNPLAWTGTSITQPIFTSTSSLGKSFRGAATFDTAIDMNTVQMTWYATGFGQPISISKIDQAFNNTEAGVISVVQASADYASNSMVSRLGSIFYGTGTGDDFDGLGNIVDDSTSTSTYAGLARTTYGTNINGFVTAASAGVLDLDTLAGVDDGATVSGTNEMTPNVGITTKAVWSLYESLLEPTKRAEYRAYGYPVVTGDTAVGSMARGDALSASGGLQSLDFRGKPLVRDEKCSSGLIFLLNEYKAEFRSLKIGGFKSIATGNKVTDGSYENVKVSGLQFRDYMEPVNQPTAEVGFFVAYGNVVHRDPRLNGKLTGVTTV